MLKLVTSFKNHTLLMRCFITAGLTVTILTSTLATQIANADDNNAVVFAAILPLSGSAAEQGEWSRRGFEIARDEVTQLGTPGVELHYEDSQGDAKKAIDAFKDLQSRFRPQVVFTWGSNVGMALTPLVNQAAVVQIGVATGTPAYSTKGDYTFRVFHSVDPEGEFIARQIIRDSRRKIALISIQNEYGISVAQSIRRALTSSDAEIVLDDSFIPNTSDFRPHLLKVRNARAELLVISAYPTEGALILRQAGELGLHLPVYASGAIIGGKSFFELAGEHAEGLKVVIPAPSPHRGQNSPPQSFAERYFQKYGESLGAFNWYSARAYDAFKIASSASTNCNNLKPECLRDSLFKLKNYDGASGVFSFDDHGDINTDFTIAQVKNKTFVPVAE